MRNRVVLLVVLISVFVRAQVPQKNVAGRVLDPSGNVVNHAAVTLRNALSGFALQTESDAAGAYSFPGVEPGEYVLTASAEGFAAQTRSVEVKSGVTTQNIDVSLTVASVQQTVTVV